MPAAARRFHLRPRRALALALAAGLASGCASAAGPRDALGWLEARGADVMDVVGVRVGLGTGLGVYARATRWAQLGAIWRGPSERELPHPKDAELRAVPCFFFGTIGRYGGAWFETSTEYMLPGWSSRDDDPLLIERDVIAGYVTPHGEGDNWEQAFGVGVHVLLVGVDVEVRPWEILDFVAGLVGYDPSSDDVPVETSPPAEGELDDAS